MLSVCDSEIPVTLPIAVLNTSPTPLQLSTIEHYILNLYLKIEQIIIFLHLKNDNAPLDNS